MFTTSEVKTLIDERKKNFIKLETAEAEGNEKRKFKVGDKVIVCKSVGSSEVLTLKETADQFNGVWQIKERPRFIHEEDFRHATAEEIFWIETLGRSKVLEFRAGDTVLDGFGQLHVVGDLSEWTSPQIIQGIYPFGSFKAYPAESAEYQKQE